MFMDINLQGLKVTALLDSGSSVNVISKSLFDKLSHNCRYFSPCVNQTITLANGSNVQIVGTAKIIIETECTPRKHTILVYI